MAASIRVSAETLTTSAREMAASKMVSFCSFEEVLNAASVSFSERSLKNDCRQNIEMQTASRGMVIETMTTIRKGAPDIWRFRGLFFSPLSKSFDFARVCRRRLFLPGSELFSVEVLAARRGLDLPDVDVCLDLM